RVPTTPRTPRLFRRRCPTPLCRPTSEVFWITCGRSPACGDRRPLVEETIMDLNALAYNQGLMDASAALAALLRATPAIGYSDPAGGFSDAYGGYSDPAGGYSDAYGGYYDPAGGYSDPAGGYSDPAGGYSDPYGGYYDPAGGYSDPAGG